MERISEKSLQQVLASRQRMLRRCWNIGRRCREHSHYKETWSDCEPVNLLVERDHKLRALDFEGACRLDEPDPPWGSPLLATWRRCSHGILTAPEAMDLHALSTSIMQPMARDRVPRQSGYRFRGDLSARATQAVSMGVKLRPSGLGPDPWAASRQGESAPPYHHARLSLVSCH
jgi:hypothetical protein